MRKVKVSWKKTSVAVMALVIAAGMAGISGGSNRSTMLMADASELSEELLTKSGGNGDILSQHGEYTVPILSLTSGAPLPAVKEAFSKAFGDSVIVTVHEDGTKTVKVAMHHMVIDMSAMGMGLLDANVTKIDGATVLSEKEEVFSNVNGSLANTPTTDTITVPNELEFPLALDENNSHTLTIGVDFMAKMYGMNIEDYATDVILTLDVNAAVAVDTSTTPPAETTTTTDSSDNTESTTTTTTATSSDSIESTTETTTTTAAVTELDKNHLSDGVYEVSVYLWHASEDRASMAASSLSNKAKIVVENGEMTMYIYTGPMTFGAITASLQEIKVSDGNGGYTNIGKIEASSADGNPTSFSFKLPNTEEYVPVLVNPHVEMMGNSDLEARLKIDYSALRIAENKSTNAEDNERPGGATSSGSRTSTTMSPKTGDSFSVGALVAATFTALASAVVFRKRKKND